MTSNKPLVLVLGATGTTGGSIVRGLLASRTFRIAAMVRPESLSKPQVDELRKSGVEIRTGDLGDGIDKLKKTLDGVDILISAVVAWAIDAQRDIIRAAKEVGVRRVVPCDFATPGAKGLRDLHDEKLAIREFIKGLNVPHTFIDVGWWMQIYLPIPLRSAAPQPLKEMTYKIFDKGQSRNLVTHLEHIGTYVARIVDDPRTLNHSVIVWEDEVSQLNAHKIGERVSGEGDALKVKRIYASLVDADEYYDGIKAGKEILEKDPDNFHGNGLVLWNGYGVSLQVLQENTLENAMKLGYLDVRRLYPDIVPFSLEEYAEEFYGMVEPADCYRPKN